MATRFPLVAAACAAILAPNLRLVAADLPARTAADGRAADGNALRGKVVRVDFWATRCGPCVTELPNVIANHGKQRERGFGVMGISGMPWPQHDDGRHWNNEFGLPFGIRAMPAMFLLDQEVRIVSTNARGGKPGREIRRMRGT